MEKWGPCINPKTNEVAYVEVSNLGRFKDTQNIIKSPMSGVQGFCIVGIFGKSIRLHMIIAECFLPPRRPDQVCVAHIDGNHSNNKASNLAWMTASENVLKTYANSSRKSNKESLSKKIRAREVGTENWTIFGSISEAARAFDLFPPRISDFLRGRRRATHLLCDPPKTEEQTTEQSSSSGSSNQQAQES